MSKIINETELEQEVLKLLKAQGYIILFGPDICPDGSHQERKSYSDVILTDRLAHAIKRLNPSLPSDQHEEVIKNILRNSAPSLLMNNKNFHMMLTEGVGIEYRKGDRIIGDNVRLIDFENPKNNEFLAVNQFTVIEDNNNRRPDIVIFINGLPVVVIELKNPSDTEATIWTAFNQLQTYKKQIPSLSQYNELLIISDGFDAKAGTITSDKDRFMPWKTVDGRTLADEFTPQLEVLIKGMLNKKVLLDLIQNFIVFETNGFAMIKKLAAYHQYYAVNKAVNTTIKAAGPHGDKRCGVVWHTQGSGKSLTMVFYARKIVLSMNNPTIVVITDRNDLDDQLFGTFGRCAEILRQEPVQAISRDHIKTLLSVASGGVIFTTIQKFFPEEKGEIYPLLSERHNIVVIADEAHRSQYDFIDGFARHMRDALPNASYIGFTGTPIEAGDKSTPAVFGDYIDIYDIEQAVKDGSTVRIYYESRLAELNLKEEEKPKIDPEFELVTEGEEVERKEKLKSRWARLEAIVGSEQRIKQIASDIVTHFENKLNILEGKGMIVCMSRRICIDLYKEIIKLRPEWHNKDDDKGIIKVIMTGSATDPEHWQEHIRNNPRRKAISERMKDPSNPLKLVIVRDMWLTGFDVPCLHTMYIDKPMRGHGLMQAIARVNRVFKDKPGGLIVDYIGIAESLKYALIDYTQSGGKGKTTINQEEAVEVMMEKYEIVCQLFYGFKYKQIFTAAPMEKLGIITKAVTHILELPDGKERFIKYVTDLSRAFALSTPNKKAIEIRDEVGFFQAVKKRIEKITQTREALTDEDLDSAIRQIISKAIVTDKVVDIFSAVGLKKPDISILSDEFLAEVNGMEHKNLAFETLKRLLNDEIKSISKRNLVIGNSFAEMLENTIQRYKNKTIETARIIEEMIDLAKGIRESKDRGEKLNLTEDELAFYDALEVNDSAVKILGYDTLKTIARELVKTVRNNLSIDWTLKESVQSKMKVAIKRLLRKHGYPPDKREKATETVLEQARLLCKDLSI
ncbi:MAG: type I restriction endonuclease subunit R [Candidatus Eremiobacterota bacterium]